MARASFWAAANVFVSVSVEGIIGKGGGRKDEG
jgi:hypothetical protein